MVAAKLNKQSLNSSLNIMQNLELENSAEMFVKYKRKHGYIRQGFLVFRTYDGYINNFILVLTVFYSLYTNTMSITYINRSDYFKRFR